MKKQNLFLALAIARALTSLISLPAVSAMVTPTEIPEHVTHIDQIRNQFNAEKNKLDLSFTNIKKIDGNVFTQIAHDSQLQNLQELDFTGTPIDQLPAEIDNLVTLKRLLLDSAPIEQVPNEIGNLVELQKLSFNGAQVVQLPATIGKLRNLKWLDLSYTPIKLLPDEIGNLSNLQILSLAYTQVGQLPPSIGNLHNLQQLHVSATQLTQLPDTVGNLSNLQQLYIDNTPITRLPAAIVRLSNLTTFELHDTKLEQQLPDEINELSNLQHLKLDLDLFIAENPEQAKSLDKILDKMGKNLRFLHVLFVYYLPSQIPEEARFEFVQAIQKKLPHTKVIMLESTGEPPCRKDGAPCINESQCCAKHKCYKSPGSRRVRMCREFRAPRSF